MDDPDKYHYWTVTYSGVPHYSESLQCFHSKDSNIIGVRCYEHGLPTVLFVSFGNLDDSVSWLDSKIKQLKYFREYLNNLKEEENGDTPKINDALQ